MQGGSSPTKIDAVNRKRRAACIENGRRRLTDMGGGKERELRRE
jgi:hypothetical protein